jgi:hypothetical protein
MNCSLLITMASPVVWMSCPLCVSTPGGCERNYLSRGQSPTCPPPPRSQTDSSSERRRLQRRWPREGGLTRCLHRKSAVSTAAAEHNCCCRHMLRPPEPGRPERETGFFHSRQGEAGQPVPDWRMADGTAHGSGSPDGKSGAAAAAALALVHSGRQIRWVSRMRDRYGWKVHQVWKVRMRNFRNVPSQRRPTDGADGSVCTEALHPGSGLTYTKK